MDAIELLIRDHRTVETLFRRYERLGPRAARARGEIFERVNEELAVHAGIEETVYYPRVRRDVHGLDEWIVDSLEEHHVVKSVLAELGRTSTTDERFDAKMHVLMTNVRHHVQEEERQWFPKVRAALSREERETLGEALDAARLIAPRQPHPHVPDNPAANLVASSLTLPLDLAGKVVRTALRRVMH